MERTHDNNPGSHRLSAQYCWLRATIALCALCAGLLALTLSDARAQNERGSSSVPGFSLFVAPNVAERDAHAPYSGFTVPPETPVLLAEDATAAANGALSSLALGLRLDTHRPLSPLDWVLMEVVLTGRRAGLIPAAMQGRAPMARATYVLGTDGSAERPRIDYSSSTFMLTRNDPGVEPGNGELLLYTVLFHGEGIALETLRRYPGGSAAGDVVSAGVIPGECRRRSASAQVPLIRGDGISIGTSMGFEQPNGSTIFDSYGPLLSSVNNNNDFHGDQVFTITARVACGSAVVAGAPLALVMLPRPEHSLSARMRDDDVPRLWFDPTVDATRRSAILNEDGTAHPDNRLPGLGSAANATRYALVSAGDLSRLQPNYSAAALNVRVAISERTAVYGEDVVFLDAHGNPALAEDLSGSQEIVLQVPPGRARFSAPLMIVDDNRHESSEDIFWGFRFQSGSSTGPTFAYVPAPANSEGYRVDAFYGDDLLAAPGRDISAILTVRDDDVLRIVHEALPPVLIPGRESVYGYSFHNSVQTVGVNIPRIELAVSTVPGSADAGMFFEPCSEDHTAVLCAFPQRSTGLRFINANAAQGIRPGQFIPAGVLRPRSSTALHTASLRIEAEISSATQVLLAAPLVLRPLSETPLVTVIAIAPGSAPPAAGAPLRDALRTPRVSEPNPAEHCPEHAFYGDSFSVSDCIKPPARFELYAVLLQSSPTAAVVASNRFGTVQRVVLPYHLPEDSDYSWTPAFAGHFAVIGQGQSSVHLGTLVIKADHLVEGDERISLRVDQPGDIDAPSPEDARLAVDYLDLPSSVHREVGLSGTGAGITIVDADSYFYTPLVYPVISTIREDNPDDLPGRLDGSYADFTVRTDSTPTRSVSVYHLQGQGYRGMPFANFGGDTWQFSDQRGAARSLHSVRHSEFRFAHTPEHPPGGLRFYSEDFVLPSMCDFADCSGSAPDTPSPSWLHGQWLPFLVPTPRTAQVAFTMYYQRQFVRDFYAKLSTRVTTHGEALGERITDERSLAVSLFYEGPHDYPDRGAFLYSVHEFHGDRVLPGEFPHRVRYSHALDYIGKTELEFHYREGGALGRAFGEPILVRGLTRRSTTTVLVDEVPGALVAGPVNPDTPLPVASGSTLRYTFRAPTGLSLRLSFFATKPASESVLAPAGRPLANSPVLLPVALYANSDPNQALMRAEVAPWRFAATEEEGVRGHSTLYLGFMEQGESPAHLDFGTLQCNSDPLRSRPTIADPERAANEQGGYYASVPHPGGASELAEYTLELGMPPLGRAALAEIHEPFLAIDSAIHCVRSHLSRYRNLHSLKCSDTREAITGTPPGACAPTRQDVILDIPRSLAVRTLDFSAATLVEGSSPEDAVAIELLTAQSLATEIPATRVLQWTLQFDTTDTRLRYDDQPIPVDGRLSVSFLSTSSATRHGGERFLRSRAMLTLATDERFQPARTLHVRSPEGVAAGAARSASLLLSDESDNVFGLALAADNTAPQLEIHGTHPVVLPLRLARVPVADTEARASLVFSHDSAMFQGQPAIDLSIMGAGSVKADSELQGANLQTTYTFSVVFPAGVQSIDSVRIVPHEMMALSTTLTLSLALKSIAGFPLVVVEDAQADALALVNSAVLELFPLREGSIKLPSGLAIASPPGQRADEGGVLSYDIVAAVGMSVRLSLDALSAHYDGAELVWSVGSDPGRTRLAHAVDSAGLESSAVYLTFHNPALSGAGARVHCPGIDRGNELRVAHTGNAAVANYRINLELPEDNGDYYGTGTAAMTRMVVRHEIACVSEGVGDTASTLPVAVACDSPAVLGSPGVCALRHIASGKSTVTVTVDDNDARIGRIDFLRNVPPGSPLYSGPATISEPLSSGIMPDDLVPAAGSTLTVVVELPGRNRTTTALPLSLRLRALDAYAQRARRGEQVLGTDTIDLNLSVPAGARRSTDTLSLGIPADELYHRPGRLGLVDTSADALDPPERSTVTVLDLGDGYYEFSGVTLSAPPLSRGKELPIRVRLLAAVAEETTVRISFDTTINAPPGAGVPGPGDFIAMPGMSALADTLVRTVPEPGRLRDELTLRFAAGTREAEALRVGFGPGFYSDSGAVAARHAVMEIPGSLSAVPADGVMITDTGSSESRSLNTALALASIDIDAASVVLQAPMEWVYESESPEPLFSVSVLSSTGTELAYPVPWTLTLRLDNESLILDDLHPSDDTIRVVTLSGGIDRSSAILQLHVPAHTPSPIEIPAYLVDVDHVLHDSHARTIGMELLAVSDAPGILEIAQGPGSSATVTVVELNVLKIDLFQGNAPASATHIDEGKQTTVTFSVENDDYIGPGFGPDMTASPDNSGPMTIAILLPTVGDVHTAIYGGSCERPVALADYCIHPASLGELSPGVRWRFATRDDDPREYLVLEADPGAVVRTGAYRNRLTLQALEDASLELVETAELDVVTDIGFIEQRTHEFEPDYSMTFSLSVLSTILYTPGVGPLPGNVFYSATPLAMTEDSTARWTVTLVNPAGETWRNELGKVIRMGLEPLAAPVHRGFSVASLRAILGGQGSYDEVAHGEALVFDIGIDAGPDGDAINEIGFLELYQFDAGKPYGTAVPPHPTMGFDKGMPALRVHVDDDDAPATVQLQRYELADDGTVVAAPGPGLDGTVIQGAAAFVPASSSAPGSLHAARRRSSFGVLFAPDRDPALPAPFESASPLLREESSSYHYVVLALSIDSTGSTSFDYQTIDRHGRLGSNDPGTAHELVELRVGQWVDGRISAAPTRYSGTTGDVQLLLLSNDPDFLSRAAADAAPRRAELRRICPALVGAGLTSTATGSLAVADGSRYNDAAFHLLDVRRDGAYYGFREDAASVEVQLLCASDPALSPDLADNSRADGSMGAEFCATRMVDNRCLLDTSGDQLDYQNYLPGFHDDDNALLALGLRRSHDRPLVEPDDTREIHSDDVRTRVTLTVQGIEMQLHADYGGDTVAFLPRANRLGAASTALQLEMAWDDAGGADVIAAQELRMSAHGTESASSSSSLLVSLNPPPSGEALGLAITVAARADDHYEHCLNHRFFADLDAELGYLDTGTATDLHVRTRRNLCRHVDDPALEDAVRAELSLRGRAPSFRLLPRLHYRQPGRQPGASAGDVTRQLEFADNAFRVRDSDSYVYLVLSHTELSEDDSSTAINVQVQFGGDSDTRYGDAADATSFLPVDLALVISGDANRLGIRYSGTGITDPVVVTSSTANVDIEIALEDPGAHAHSYDPLGLRGMWLETSLLAEDSSVRELLLFSEDATGTSTATRYDLGTEHSADPVLGNIVSIVRLRGLLPAAEPIDVMRIRAVDDGLSEGVDSFAVQLGILSATQSRETDGLSSRRIHSQRASRTGELARVLVDTSQGIGRSYSTAFDDLHAAGRPVHTRASISIGDNDVPHAFVRDNTATVVFLENDLPRDARETTGVDTRHFPLDPEGDDYQEELTRISVLDVGKPDGENRRGSGALLRMDLASPLGTDHLPAGQRYQVLYHYTTPTMHTVRHDLDVQSGDSLYLLMGNPALVESGGACADRVADLGLADKPLIKVGEHPVLIGPGADIREQLPHAGLVARLFFAARDDGSHDFHGEGAFNYSLTLLCSDSTLFDPENPDTDVSPSFCIADGIERNLVEDDLVDGGAACTMHRSRRYAVRDANHVLVVAVHPFYQGTRKNYPGEFALSLAEPDAARPEIARPAILSLNNTEVTVELHHRIYGNSAGNATGRGISLVLPSLEEIFVAPFAGHAGGMPFVVAPGSAPARIDAAAQHYTWFHFGALANDYLDGPDRVVELSLGRDVLSDMPERVVHAHIASALEDTPSGYTPLVLASEFSAALRLRDSDNYYYYLEDVRTPERDDDSAARPVTVVFGATRLGQAILDADPLAGDLFGMRLARVAADTSGIPPEYQPATLDDLFLHNLDTLPGPGPADPGSVFAPGSIPETDIGTGRDNLRLVAASSSASGVVDDTARVPFYFAASFDRGRMHLFDIGAVHDRDIEMDEALDLFMDLRFLGRPALSADFGLHPAPSAALGAMRASIGTALPIVIPFEAQSPYAAVFINTDTRVTTRYVITGPGTPTTPTAPTLASLSFSELSLPDSPLLLAVDLHRSRLRRNVFFDDARVALARGDATLPTSAASTHMRHCEDEDCNNRRYRMYLQLGPYSGDDGIVLRAVPSDISDPHFARRARCASGLADPIDRAAPYLIANVLKNPVPRKDMRAYNDSDARYALGNDGKQLHLVLSDDGVSPDKVPLLEGLPETVLYDEVGIASLRFSILCSDDFDYTNPRTLPVCGMGGAGCAREQDVPLIVRGPTLVYRFAMTRNDDMPLFISDPVLSLREPDAPATDPLVEHFGGLDFPERNAPSMGAELQVYATLASGPTPESGMDNSLRLGDGGVTGLELVSLAPREFFVPTSGPFSPRAHSLCVPRGRDQAQNYNGSEPGDAVIGDCELIRASAPAFGQTRFAAYMGRMRVLDDKRWEPIAADEFSQIAYPGQRGYYIPGDGLAALSAPTRANWLTAPQPPFVALSSEDEPLLPDESTMAPRMSAVAYPARLYIRDAEATLSLSFDETVTVVDGVAQLDRNAGTTPAHTVTLRLHIGAQTGSNELPLGLPVPGSSATLRLPPVVPGCRNLRRSTVGDYHHPLQLVISRRAGDGTAHDPQDFLGGGALSAAFSLNHTRQDLSQPGCGTPYHDPVHGHQLPAARYEGLPSNPLYYDLILGPGSVPRPGYPDATAEYVFTLAPRTEILDGGRAHGPDNSAADALYRLYDTRDGSYARRLRMRVGDMRPPIVCAGTNLDTRPVEELLASGRDCLLSEATAAYVVQSSWTLAVDYRADSLNSSATADVFVSMDGPLPTPVSPHTSPPVTVSVLSSMSPYSLHYYTPGSNADPCAPPAPGALPSAYRHHLALPVDAEGAAPRQYTLEAAAGMRAGRRHCIALSASDGLYTSYTEAVALTLPPYRPTRDRNNNAIPDDAELSRYPVPGDTTDSTVSGEAYGRAYCDEVSPGSYNPALGARNDCDGDGVPDLVELALDIPGHTRPRDEGLVRSAMCFAASLRTRLPLPEGARLHCSGDGAALLHRLDEEWRMVLDGTHYRGLGHTLGAAIADDAPGRDAGGLLPSSYWLVDPGFSQLLHFMLLPRVVLDAPPRVPVYTRYEYVDGGQVLHPELLGEPPERQRFTHRGESYRGPGSSSTLYYAISEDSLDPDRARSLPQELGMRLFGSTAAVDELSYHVELLSEGESTSTRLGARTVVQSGAIGGERALIADVPLLGASPLRFSRGTHVLSVVLQARTDRLILEKRLDARVDGVLAANDALRARMVAAGGGPTEPGKQFPYGYPLQLDMRMSGSFYAAANTPRHAPLVHFTPGRENPGETLTVLNVDAIASSALAHARMEWYLLNYASGREVLLSTQSLGGMTDSAAAISWPGEHPLSTDELCMALGGCDFDSDTDAFYLFQLRAVLVSDVRVESETRLPAGTYVHTHNRDRTGSSTEVHTVSEAGQLRVVYERLLPAPVQLAQVTQMVQLGGALPGEVTGRASYLDDDYDGVPDNEHEANISQLDFSITRSTPLATLHGSIQTSLRFARVHLGGYGRAAYQRLDAANPLPPHGANIARFEDAQGNRPEYPTRDDDPRSDFALDFFVSCDARSERGQDSGFDGSTVSIGIARSVPIQTGCLGALTPVLLLFPEGTVPVGVLPAQIVTLNPNSEPSVGYGRAPTGLCKFVHGDTELSAELQERRTANGCPALVANNGRSVDSGDSFAFADFNSEGVCPDVHDESQWTRINEPALGGERCLRLLISDNGPNDMAPVADVIADPLVWSLMDESDGSGVGDLGGPSAPDVIFTGGLRGPGGGATMGLWSLLVLLMLAGLYSPCLHSARFARLARRR